MLIRCDIVDLDQIIELYQACGAHLTSKGIDQWEGYPTPEIIQMDVERGELFREIDQDLAGVICLNTIQDDSYETLTWGGTNFMVVHRLAVWPDQQGRGAGRRLMRLAEEFAVQNGYDSIRLDAYNKNSGIQYFYNSLGYKEVGHVYFRGLDKPFTCFEKIIV